MSPKDFLAELLYRVGITRHLVRPAADLLIVFGYHRIRPQSGRFHTPFDGGVFGPSVRRFREQLEWLRRRTRILSEQELIGFLQAGEPLPGPCSLVTFDDGYRDNHALALPILEELGVPATFFIPSHLIDARRLGWWDLIAYFIKQSRKSSIMIDGRQHPLGNDRGAAIEHFHLEMKRKPAEATANLLEKISAACEVPFPSVTVQDAELMSWDEIRDAAARGIAIGSHTHTHRVLTTLDRASVDEELRASKVKLQDKIGQEIRTLAYPCGSYEDFDEVAQNAAGAAGYRLAFSFNTGVQHREQLQPMDVRRLGASGRASRLAAITVFPRVFAWAS